MTYLHLPLATMSMAHASYLLTNCLFTTSSFSPVIGIVHMSGFNANANYCLLTAKILSLFCCSNSSRFSTRRILSQEQPFTVHHQVMNSKQCGIAASKGNHILGLIRRNITYKEKTNYTSE